MFPSYTTVDRVGHFLTVSFSNAFQFSGQLFGFILEMG